LSFTNYEFPVQRQFHLRPLRSIQDGLTPNEISFLAYLWNNGRQGDSQENFRVIGIGDRRLADALGHAYMTSRNLTAALQDKLALVVRPPKDRGTNAPKTFVVFSYAEILRRWRKADLLYVMRRNGGLALCNSVGTIIAPKAIALKVSKRALNVTATTTCDKPPTFGATNQPSIALNVKEHIRNQITTPSNKPAPPPDLLTTVISTIAKCFGHCDDQYANRLVEEVLNTAPDVSSDEFYCFLCQHAPTIIQNTRIESKTGVLLARAKTALTGESLRQLRANLPTWRKQQLAWILRNPAMATDAERTWAQHLQTEIYEATDGIAL